MLPSGNTARITQGVPGSPNAASELSVEDEGIKELLAQSTDKKKKKKTDKKKKKGDIQPEGAKSEP